MNTTKKTSRILSEIHETATGLYRVGLIDKKNMGEFIALSGLSVSQMSAEQIQTLRLKFKLSQAVFAKVLNISVSTIQKWEIGDKKPSGTSLKLLNLIERKGLEVVL